jgi:hypothetical protein
MSAEVLTAPEFVYFKMNSHSMDVDNKRAICKNDILKCQEIVPATWRTRQSAEILKDVVILSNGHLTVGKIINQNLCNESFTLHFLNPDFKDLVICIGDVDRIFCINSISRDMTPRALRARESDSVNIKNKLVYENDRDCQMG